MLTNSMSNAEGHTEQCSPEPVPDRHDLAVVLTKLPNLAPCRGMCTLYAVIGLAMHEQGISLCSDNSEKWQHTWDGGIDGDRAALAQRCAAPKVPRLFECAAQCDLHVASHTLQQQLSAQTANYVPTYAHCDAILKHLTGSCP